MDVQRYVPDELHNLVVPDEAFEADDGAIGIGIRESAPAGGEGRDAFGADGEDELALCVEVEEGFVVDGAVDVEEVDWGPAVGEGPVSGEDFFRGEMVVVDHVADFER